MHGFAVCKRRGFTLMEMLVVISIIIVMTALSIPAISKFLEGQSLAQSGRVVQSAFNEARRAAITQRVRNYLVFFSAEDPSRPGINLHAMRRYRERVGYDGEAQSLIAGVQFDIQGVGGGTVVPTGLTTPTAGRANGIEVVIFEGMPDEGNTELFGTTRRPNQQITGWIEFRQDGTINLESDKLKPKIPPEIGSENLFDLNAFIEVNQTTFDQISGVGGSAPTVDMCLRESGDFTVDKRCFLDIDPNTGRVSFRVLQVSVK